MMYVAQPVCGFPLFVLPLVHQRAVEKSKFIKDSVSLQLFEFEDNPLTFVVNSAVAPFPVLALLPTTQLSTDARRHPRPAACIWDFGGLQWRMFASP